MKNIPTILLSIVVVGCAATPLNPGAEQVRITTFEPSKECKFLGDVVAGQGGAFSGPMTANDAMEVGARNDMKNKAAGMCGNVVVMQSHQTGQTGRANYYSGSSQQTNVTLTANVYCCGE